MRLMPRHRPAGVLCAALFFAVPRVFYIFWSAGDHTGGYLALYCIVLGFPVGFVVMLIWAHFLNQAEGAPVIWYRWFVPGVLIVLFALLFPPLGD